MAGSALVARARCNGDVPASGESWESRGALCESVCDRLLCVSEEEDMEDGELL